MWDWGQLEAFVVDPPICGRGGTIVCLVDGTIGCETGKKKCLGVLIDDWVGA